MSNMSKAWYGNADVFCFYHKPEESEPDVNNEESDSPVHCSECHEPLEYILTPDGIEYVLNAMREELKKGRKEYLKKERKEEGYWYSDVPHITIVRDWAEELKYYGLGEKDLYFVYRFLSWTEYQMKKES